jgi:hypothetical protein
MAQQGPRPPQARISKMLPYKTTFLGCNPRPNKLTKNIRVWKRRLKKGKKNLL